MCKLLAALLVACVPAATAAGAFGSLWLIDGRGVVEAMWSAYELFTVDHPKNSSYGQNEFAMVASHASQYWFEVYGHRTIKFIGYASCVFLIAKLIPMLRSLCVGL